MNTEPDLLWAAQPAGLKWSEARDLFVKYADRFNAADRHEIASAIADEAGREIMDRLSAAHQPEPDIVKAARVIVADYVPHTPEEAADDPLGCALRLSGFEGNNDIIAAYEAGRNAVHQPAAPTWGKVRDAIDVIANISDEQLNDWPNAAWWMRDKARVAQVDRVIDSALPPSPEAVARVIDPEAFAEAERLLGLKWNGRAAPATDRAAEVIAPALAKARTIIAMAPPADAVGAHAERAREHAARRIASHIAPVHAPFLARLEPEEIGTLQLETYSVARAEIDLLAHPADASQSAEVERVGLPDLTVGLVGAHRGEPDWCKLTLTYETSAWALAAHEAVYVSPPAAETEGG